ncbi:MAG TPA: hydrolase [Clostridiales bacterium]|nr:hydrolase [Clostridiales bacterium]
MKISIIRGQNQIGGSIIEVSTDSTRIILDIGINLIEDSPIDVPQIDGLFCGAKNVDAVFISHYHADHMGLVNHLLPEIPVYMGAKAYRVLSASADYRGTHLGFYPEYLIDKKTVVIDDMCITPYKCDHSAFDSYMFLIKCGEKTVLYTGDFRANGRHDFMDLLQSLPEVDAVIIEGTMLSRDDTTKNIEEEFLEKIATSYLRRHNGPAFIMMSAQNIDRIKTAYEVAKITNRLFLEDIYTADITVASDYDLPVPDKKNGIRVFSTGGDKQYAKLQKYKEAKIGKYEIAKKPFLMCIRQSMKNYLEKLSDMIPFDDGVLFYAMWKGYMEQPEMETFLHFMRQKGIKIHILHTSGHADPQTIDALIKDVTPKIIIPVHTENAQWFERYKNISYVCYDKEIII